MTIDEWRRIAEATLPMTDAEFSPQMLAHKNASHPARVIAAVKVIEAAKGLRSYAEGTGAALDFDDALAELEALP